MTRSVVCFCYHVSHVLNLGRIPSLLAGKGWEVKWLNAFPKDYFPLLQDNGIEYAFNAGLQELASLQSDLYLTPFVGQSSHFPDRAKRVHFLVSLTSLEGVYDKGMFDGYDVIACAGQHHVDELTALGVERGWREKQFSRVGYPKLDGQRRLLGSSGLRPKGDVITVVFAPTHAYYVNHQYSVLRQYGEQIVRTLIAAGVRVIFRPHVESWRDQDRPVVNQIVDMFKNHPMFLLDVSGNYFETYAQSDLMITDISGTGFTFAFTFDRPALFFAPDEAAEYGKIGLQFEHRQNIGLVVRSIDELLSKVGHAYAHTESLKPQIDRFRKRLVFNSGHSEEWFAGQAESLIEMQPQATGSFWKKIWC